LVVGPKVAALKPYEAMVVAINDMAKNLSCSLWWLWVMNKENKKSLCKKPEQPRETVASKLDP